MRQPRACLERIDQIMRDNWATVSSATQAAWSVTAATPEPTATSSTRGMSVMSERQRYLIGLLLLVVGIGIASSQALLASCSGSAVAASVTIPAP